MTSSTCDHIWPYAKHYRMHSTCTKPLINMVKSGQYIKPTSKKKKAQAMDCHHFTGYCHCSFFDNRVGLADDRRAGVAEFILVSNYL